MPWKYVSLLFDFYYNGVRQFLVRKKKLKFFGGTPRSGPLKIWKFSKVIPPDLLYPNVFFVESISTIKIRMFAKTRAQNIEFWPNDGHFYDDQIIFEISKKISKFLFLVNFLFFSPFFWYWQVWHSFLCIHKISMSNNNLDPLIKVLKNPKN